MHSFKSTKPISKDEEYRLIRKAQKGDRGARERLIQANTRFVVKLAVQKARFNPSADLDDYIQEGLFGLNVAIDKFDFKKAPAGIKLIGYAVAWIKVRQDNLALNTHSLVKYGTTQTQRTLFSAVRRGIEYLEYELKRDPTDAELADYLEMDEEEVATARQRVYARDSSLDKRSGVDEEGVAFVERLASAVLGPDEQLANLQKDTAVVAAVQKAIKQLTPREQDVIRRRFMEDGEWQTLTDIGAQWGVSRERARQVEKKALVHLKQLLKPLRPLVKP